MEIVLAEERMRGNSAHALAGAHLEKAHGCDILSTVPGQDDPTRIEVKGWGTPLIAAGGKFNWPLELQVSQHDAARTVGVSFRAEIVANLRAYLDHGAPYERLTVPGAYISTNAVPSAYAVPLEGLRDAVHGAAHSPILTSRLRVLDVPSEGAGWDEIGAFAIKFPGWTATEIDWDALYALVEEVQTGWTRNGELPGDIDLLRVCLLWEQRRLRHLQTGPGGEYEDGADELPYAQALVGAIRRILGQG